MNKISSVLLLLIGVFLGCGDSDKKEKYQTSTQKDDNGFSYETVSDDPTGLRLYTLENGLKVYLSQNSDEPKIQTYIAVRAGSVYDPADNTGLAHYLEHMVFKGTDEIGTQQWAEEKKILEKISLLYEEHKNAVNADDKKRLYQSIDSLSLAASGISIANEYDKMVSSLGAEDTNAWTWHEETVYTNKIPSNELEKWLYLESERFSQLVLRLFHTELEAVYEEFNRGQDNDSRKQNYALMDGLFPTHPYGQQTTIGTSEHLKNPSMEAIHKYFDTYYVPNNIAVVLVGDIDFDKTIAMVDNAFGQWKGKEVNHPERPKEDALTTTSSREVYGPETERIFMAYRSEGIGSDQEKYIVLIDYILANSAAGLIDLNLNQQQKVQRAGSYSTFFNDYGMHTLYGYPKSGQTLEEVQNLLLDQIALVKKGEFDDWMIEAVANDLKLTQIKSYEDASAVAGDYVSAFVHFQPWSSRIGLIDDIRNVSKEQLVEFANSFYGDNYVVVNKKQGESKDLVKVENPGITPIALNRDKTSDFLEKFNEMEVPEITPKFVDYDTAIKKSTLENGLEFSFIENPSNDLAELYFLFDLGKDHDRKLGLAVEYLAYLGTDTQSAEELKKEFYRLGVNYGVNSGNDRSNIYVSGLRENIDKGLEILERLWTEAVPDQEAYDKLVLQIAKGREEGKANKGNILWNGLMNYGQYGENSRLRDIYTIEELKAIKPSELVNIIKDLRNYKHSFFYFGKEEKQGIAAIEARHTVPAELKEYPEIKEYEPLEMDNQVYFVDYDMVQAELLFLAKGTTFDAEKMAISSLFNSYFGSGLSSIVFQEIRESKSLAYSAFSSYQNAAKAKDPNYVYAYVGTQANKMDQAMSAMMDLMENMPEAAENFKAAKEATIKQLAADRINKTNIFWSYQRLKDRGLNKDVRQDMYAAIQEMTIEDLRGFFEENIQGSKYNLMVIGNKKDVDIKALQRFGKIKELDLDYLFNYEKPLPLKS